MLYLRWYSQNNELKGMVDKKENYCFVCLACMLGSVPLNACYTLATVWT